MSDDHRPSIPLDSYPDPALIYTVEDDIAVVTSVNDTFEDAFDAPIPETVREVFDRFNRVDATSERSPNAAIRQDEPVGALDGPPGSYAVRNVRSDDDSGALVFTSLKEMPRPEPVGIDHVASIVSHDLRNPLDVAKAHRRAAAETGDREHFEAMAEAHERMETIIGDVLTLARGESVVDPVGDVSIERAAQDAWQSVDTERASLSVASGLPEPAADPDRLRRLFENLFRNAVEHGSTSPRSHTPEDAVEHSAPNATDADLTDGTIEVVVEALEDGFAVADDGPGIPPAKRDAVFEDGYTTHDRGTGLGLAIVERVVDAHGWRISLTDAERGGARFEIRFDRQTDG